MWVMSLEEMAVVNGKLYAANSGGYYVYSGGAYDRTVSVIDLASFTVAKNIDVEVNLHRLRASINASVSMSAPAAETTPMWSLACLLSTHRPTRSSIT